MIQIDKQLDRFMELEGLRGIAAIVVVAFHALLMFYPGLFYGPGSYGVLDIQNIRYEHELYATPVMGLLTGSFSVAIFFVLSGFVLSVGFLKNGDPNTIKRIAAKRYVRLMLPVMVSILLAYIILQFGLDTWKEQLAQITHSSWLAERWVHVPNFWDALVQGIYGVFVNGGSSYNPVLWTIKIELIGSFIIFGIALLFSSSKYRWFVYLALSIIFLTSWYLAFIVGMVLADLFVNYRKYLQAIPSWSLVIGAIVGIGLGAFPPTEIEGTLFNGIIIPGLTQEQNMSLYLTIGATFVTLAVLLVPKISRFFSSQKISFLGKYTFSLYLIHLPVLFTLGAGSYLIIGSVGVLSSHLVFLLSMLVTGIALTYMTYLFEKYIDTPSIKLSSILTDIYNGRREIKFTFYLWILRERVIVGLKSIKRNFVSSFEPFKYKKLKARFLKEVDLAREESE